MDSRKRVLQHQKNDAKPLIDKNLQWNFPNEENEDFPYKTSYHDVYRHFISSWGQSHQVSYEQKELLKKMADASKAYEAWKKMHNQLSAYF